MDQELMNSINKIYACLNLNELTDEMVNDINKYMNDYHQTLNAYINSDVKNEYITNRLQMLSGPINYILKNFNNDNYPAVKMIKDSLNDDNMINENSFNKTLKKKNTTSYSDDNYLMNGFTLSTVIIAITIILGIILAIVALIIN